MCEHHKRIDIRFMRKRGLLRAGRVGTLSWSLGDESAGFINYRTHEWSLELDYKFREGGDEWQPINEHIRFAEKEQPFGGVRRYFLCPSCYRRCLVLYGGSYFRCRKCYGLVYASQNEDGLDRMRRKAEKIRTRLGDKNGIDWLFPEKPKGMHWRTYERLRDKGQALEVAHERALCWRIAGLADLLRSER